MATPREIKNRINSVQNTRKITKTMELVATAKSKKAVDRVNASQPYADKVRELIHSLAGGGLDFDHPLLRKEEKPKKVLLIPITSNRGLAGPYNANVLKVLIHKLEENEQAGIESDIFAVGKKSINFLKFQKISMRKQFTDFDDRVTFAQIEEFANEIISLYEEKEIDGVDIIYTRYVNAGVQRAEHHQLLPLSLDAKEEGGTQAAYMFEPEPEKILTSLLPRSFKVMIYQAMLDSVASEQIARRIAMKNATDSASDMIKQMNLQYNRARQAKVTQEIAEIVSGVDALS